MGVGAWVGIGACSGIGAGVEIGACVEVAAGVGAACEGVVPSVAVADDGGTCDGGIGASALTRPGKLLVVADSVEMSAPD